MIWLGYTFLQGKIPEVSHKLWGLKQWMLCVCQFTTGFILGNTLLQEENQRWPTGQSLWHSDLSTIYVLQDILFVVEL